MLELPRRLDKFVRESTRLSLVEARLVIANGRVHCSRLGVPGDPLDQRALIFPGEEVSLDGVRLSVLSSHVTLVFSKPKGITSTTNDPRGRGDLARFMKAMPEGVFPVGRLDRETTGALLFTTDGDLASCVLRPEHELEKEYWLWLDECVEDADARLSKFIEGIPMLGSVGRASRVSVVSRTEDTTELLVFLREGKNRQIRRMCRALDFRLLHLHRRAIGPVRVEDLRPGEFRELSEQEVASLYHAAGGISALRKKQLAALSRHADECRKEGHPDKALEAWLATSHPVIRADIPVETIPPV